MTMSPRRTVALGFTLALATLSLLAAGCDGGGSPGVPSAASSTSPSVAQTTTTATQPDAVAFSRCMRTHGLADFPDPDSSGNINLKDLNAAPGSDLDPSSSAFRGAQKACKGLEPPTFAPGGQPTSAARRQQDLARSLSFSRCMRAHGIGGFPDPDSDGRLSVQSIRSAGVGPASPQFRTAIKACGRFKPGNIVIGRAPGNG